MSIYESRRNFVNKILESRNDIIQHSLRGQNLWCIVNDGKENHIVLFILAHIGHEWFCNEIDESDGFYSLTCPKRFINYVDDLDEKCIGGLRWRKAVFKKTSGKMYHKLGL